MPVLMICQLKKKTGSLNNKIFFMKKDLINEKKIPASETIVIADECGDSMWDAVLQQEIKSCEVKVDSTNTASLLNKIDAVQEGDATEAK